MFASVQERHLVQDSYTVNYEVKGIKMEIFLSPKFRYCYSCFRGRKIIVDSIEKKMRSMLKIISEIGVRQSMEELLKDDEGVCSGAFSKYFHVTS